MPVIEKHYHNIEWEKYTSILNREKISLENLNIKYTEKTTILTITYGLIREENNTMTVIGLNFDELKAIYVLRLKTYNDKKGKC